MCGIKDRRGLYTCATHADLHNLTHSGSSGICLQCGRNSAQSTQNNRPERAAAQLSYDSTFQMMPNLGVMGILICLSSPARRRYDDILQASPTKTSLIDIPSPELRGRPNSHRGGKMSLQRVIASSLSTGIFVFRRCDERANI